ncbi:MAG: hypothetical protein OHK0028_23630 [Deltaproteobacteria bacterium]
MADKRQAIVDAVRARLAGIRTANGYNTDVGLHVFEWKVTAFADSDLPGVAFRDTDSKIRELTGGMQEVSLPVEIIVGAASGASTMQVLRAAIDDILSAINSDFTWGGLAWETSIDTIETLAEHEGKLIGLAKIVATVKYEQPRPVHP